MPENNSEKNHLLIFGLGYAATAIASEAADKFDIITATRRNLDTEENDNCRLLVFDGFEVSPELRQAIESASHILISIGPDKDGDAVLNVATEFLRAAKNLKWLGYLSTVGVYGNHEGEWVDEDTPCLPVSERSLQRLSAENLWQKLAAGKNIPLAIFRLSGIYGPGRNAFVNIAKGRSRRLVKKGQVFNRIHRDDIARAVTNAMELNAEGIFNITDDEPAPPQGVVTYAHELQGSTPPDELDFETADITPMARSFYGENKRVSNAKSKSVLNMQYRWPNYRDALDAMWEDATWEK